MKRILIVYTGGTIGMVYDARTASLRPVALDNIRRLIPEIERLPVTLEYYSFLAPIDSSNVLPETWLLLARIIHDNYERYDGFVILHGTDTMAYTASALSFLLQNLAKPVILTGAQLPMDQIRTDARDNLINALVIASTEQHSLAEVGICFDGRLTRGNRTIKYSSEKFHAFVSPNFPPLVEAGVHMAYYTQHWLAAPTEGSLQIERQMDSAVGLLKFYPGIPQEVVRALLNAEGLKAFVLETYGTGNLPEYSWLLNLLAKRVDEGLILVNVSQCPAGGVEQGRYATSTKLVDMGVVSGADMTTEAAVTKLSYLLALHQGDATRVRHDFGTSLRGELTAPNQVQFTEERV